MDREEAIFEAAVQIPDCAQRNAYLAAACEGDAVLRKRIEKLVAADRDGFFDQPLVPPAVAVSIALGESTCSVGAPATSNAPYEVPGQRIDRYKLMEKIGEGGCGVVYVAEQTEPVRRRVALKVIKLGMDTRAVVARFEAERQALAMMDHPNIAKVLDAGTTAQGRPYFVMELVRGIRITEYCDQANLSTRDRLELFIKVCQAIQHAHQKGIIHRDIKPSNILVTLHDGVPAPKVIDFGIAKATEGRLTDATVYTQLHQFIGTPAYMSPEQAEMSGLDIDTRSDIYSLGVLLYELLAGSTPFDAKELMSKGVDAMRKIIREKEPPRPSTRVETLGADELTTTAKRRSADTSKLLHQLLGDLDWIVMKCLEKDRTRRYETANGLAVDLKRHLNNEPVSARSPSNLYRFQKAFRRNKLTFAAAGAVAAALLLGVLVSTWQAVRATKSEREQAKLREVAVKALDGEKAQRTQAEAERGRAVSAEAKARQNLYAAHMNLANEAIGANNLGYALELLDRHRPEPGQPDMRGWEWRYLWKQTRSDALETLGAHSNSVLDVVFSPKGDLLATCSDDRTVKLWDMVRRREIATLPHEQSVRTAVFLAEGKALATASADGLLRVWDLELRKVVARLPIGRIAPLTGQSGLAFSPRGELVAVAEPDGTVKVWDVGTKAKTAAFHGQHVARRLAFSWDAQVLAASHADDALVELFDVARQERIYCLTNDAAEGVGALAFSRDGRMLACACSDVEPDRTPIRTWPIRVWDLGARQKIRTLSGHAGGIWKLDFSPDGKTLASANGDHTARLWDMNAGQSTTLRGHLNEVWAIAFAPDGLSLVTGIRDPGHLALWSAFAKPVDKNAQVISSTVENQRRRPMLSPDGTALLKVYDEKEIGVWDTDILTERTRFPLPLDPKTSLAISPGGKLIAQGAADGSLRLIEVATRREAAIPSQRGAAIEALSFSRDGGKLATASADRKLRIWDVATQKLLHEIEGHPSQVFGYDSALAFSVDGLTLGVGYEDNTAELIDVRGGTRLCLLEGHKNPVCGAMLLPDGKTAVTASLDQSVKFWDVPTQRVLETLHGEALALFSMALSPDGRRLAAGGPEGVIRLWDPTTRQLVAAMKGQVGESIDALAFSPDGNTLVARTTSQLRVWRAPSLAEIDAAEAKEKARAQGP